MAWIESHQALGTHRKLLRLMSQLSIKDIEAVGLLQYLWWWSLDNAPDGDLTGLDPQELAFACHWTGDPLALQAALISAHFLDFSPETETLTLHDWDDYAGKLIAARISNRDHQRAHRLRNRDVSLTSGYRQGATQPNPTQQNPTKDTISSNDTPQAAKKKGLEDYKTALHDLVEARRSALREQYPNVDIDFELEKFAAYWDGHDAKHRLKNMALGLVNWMAKVRAGPQQPGNHKAPGWIPPDNAFAHLQIIESGPT